jgi:hypothetical protein
MGFWEHRLFQGVNIQFLRQLGGNSDGFGAEMELYRAFSVLENGNLGDEITQQISDSLAEQFTGPCWGFKDPRSVLSYPLWEKLLRELGYRHIKPMVMIRRPEACIQSLLKRGDALSGMPRGMDPTRYLLDIWRAYYRILAEVLDLDTCLVMSQEDLIDPQRAPRQLQRMADWIGQPDADHSEALAWINPRMDHRRADSALILDPELESLDALFRSKTCVHQEPPDVSLPAAPPAVEMPPSWCIYVVSPIRYAHAEAFSEMAQTLHHGFEKLGIEAPIVRNRWELRGTPVVLGANLLPRHPLQSPLPEDSILYNLEQVEEGSAWLQDDYLDLLRRYRVWDYSSHNIAELKRLGIDGVRLCEIGYVPELSRIPHHTEDVDILFYGSLNQRRRRVLKQLAAKGAKVKYLSGTYGLLRDTWIARSKIILNIHYYEAKVLEIVRLSYLLGNGRFVVSERGKDATLEAPFEKGMVLDSYEMLVPQCLTWLQHAEARQAIAAEGQRIFSARDQAEFLRPLVLPET